MSFPCDHRFDLTGLRTECLWIIQRASCPAPLAVNQQWLFFNSHCPLTPRHPWPPTLCQCALCQANTVLWCQWLSACRWVTHVFPVLTPVPWLKPVLCVFIQIVIITTSDYLLSIRFLHVLPYLSSPVAQWGSYFYNPHLGLIWGCRNSGLD